MTRLPETVSSPRARTAASSPPELLDHEERVPAPDQHEIALEAPVRTGPVTRTSVFHWKAGPSSSSAARVVRSLMVDAGFRGTSGRWLTSGVAFATSRTHTLSEFAGRRWRSSASSTGPAAPPGALPDTESKARSTARMAVTPWSVMAPRYAGPA